MPELGTSVFIGPGDQVKNGDERLVVLISIARSVVERRRGVDSDFVFTHDGKRIARMMTSGWKRARARAGLSQVRVHDLKYKFGRRLRATGVSFEDRQDLLGHRPGRITTHYSAVELSRLIEAAERVSCGTESAPQFVVLKGKLHGTPAKLLEGREVVVEKKVKSLKSPVPATGLEPVTP